MIETLNSKGLNLSSIAQDANLQPTRLYSAIKQYDTRAKTILKPNEEKRVYAVLRKLHRTLGKSIEDFDNQ